MRLIDRAFYLFELFYFSSVVCDGGFFNGKFKICLLIMMK